MKDVLNDLYGGDGITLGNAFHSAHFNAVGIAAFNDLSTTLIAGLGQNALTSASTSVTFDLELGIATTEESLGPLLAERATTVGKDKINLGLSFTSISFSSVDSTDLDQIELIFPHQDCCDAVFGNVPDGIIGPPGPGFELDVIELNIELELKQHILSFFSTYGITDRWDVGAVIPILQTVAKSRAVARVVDNGGGPNFHTFVGAPDSADSSAGGSKTGIGDILLRSKYRFTPDESWGDMALVGQIGIPTGDADQLLGTGEARFLGMFIASREGKRLSPHLNFGYEATTGLSTADSLRYTVGSDAKITDSFSAALELLGRYSPRLEGTGNHAIDLAASAKWNPFDIAPIHAAIQVPLNEDGLRANFIWTLGVESTF